MKTTKRVIAVALAVLMLALAIPFAASAATTTYSLTVQCDKPDYTYTVYKIADFNETTGAYENFATTAIGTAIKNSTDSTAAVLTAADAATLTGGTDVAFTSSKTSETLTGLAAGMYYIKCTSRSIKNTSISQNNIVPLPNKDMAAGATAYTVDVATNKIKEGNEPGIIKKIQKADETLVDELSVSQDDTITYVLTADVTGTKDNKLAKFIVADDLDTENLSLDDVDIKSVQLVNGSEKTNLGNTAATSEELTSVKGFSYDFGVSINSDELNKDSFYTAGNKVVVTFTTKLTAAAKIGSAIPNKTGLKYENKSGNANEVKGNTVNVYTYKVKVTKVDADSTSTTLQGAKIGIFSSRDCNSNEKIAEATTGDDGTATFDYKFAEGTYYVKELAAPANYNLNTSVFEVKIEKGSTSIEDGIHNTVVIPDTKSKLPNTGREGTMMFTIIGGSLILLAGVLFVVVMKKRKASK